MNVAPVLPAHATSSLTLPRLSSHLAKRQLHHLPHASTVLQPITVKSDQFDLHTSDSICAVMAHGASGAVGTAGDFTAESAPSVSQPSAGGEQSRRKLQPGNTTPRQFPKGLNLFAKDGTLCYTLAGDFRVRGEASATDQGVRTVNYPIPEGLNN
ncbi:unnamed protein product [Closterium sp. Yama58-4]|nr:unnamed protein product [Closterium sp. Yama58-4]